MTKVLRLGTWGFFENLPLGGGFGEEVKTGVGDFVGVCGSKVGFGSGEQHLGSRVAKGLKRESKDWDEFSNNPELKFGSPHLKQCHETFLRA